MEQRPTDTHPDETFLHLSSFVFASLTGIRKTPSNLTFSSSTKPESQFIEIMKLCIAALSLIAGATAFTTSAPRAFNKVGFSAPITTGLQMAKQGPHGGELVDLMLDSDDAKSAATAACTAELQLTP
eukprot:654873_1